MVDFDQRKPVENVSSGPFLGTCVSQTRVNSPCSVRLRTHRTALVTLQCVTCPSCVPSTGPCALHYYWCKTKLLCVGAQTLTAHPHHPHRGPALRCQGSKAKGGRGVTIPRAAQPERCSRDDKSKLCMTHPPSLLPWKLNNES